MAESFEDSSLTNTVQETSKYNHEKKTFRIFVNILLTEKNNYW